MNNDWKSEKTISINPSWVLQTMVLIVLGVASYFIDKNLTSIEAEMQLSRIERAQLRADMSALEIGLRGDRFTRSDFDKEQADIQRQLDALAGRVLELERNR